MYDKLSVVIDVLAEDAATTSAEKEAAVYIARGKADGKPFIPQIDHIAKSKLELAARAQKLQQSLKLIIFQVEQGKVLRVIMARIEKHKPNQWLLL